MSCSLDNVQVFVRAIAQNFSIINPHASSRSMGVLISSTIGVIAKIKTERTILMNILALVITIPLLITITLFLTAIAYMQYLTLKNDKDLKDCRRATSSHKS